LTEINRLPHFRRRDGLRQWCTWQLATDGIEFAIPLPNTIAISRGGSTETDLTFIKPDRGWGL